MRAHRQARPAGTARRAFTGVPRSDHAVADARFLRGAHVQVTRRIARTGGDMAWVATESTIHAHGDKPASLLSTETMVLERKGNAWRIVQIHWSSQER